MLDNNFDILFLYYIDHILYVHHLYNLQIKLDKEI